MDIVVLVPSHGTPTIDVAEIQARITADRAYLTDLRVQITKALDEGLNVVETVETCTDFQHHCLETNADAHRLNIESVYLELGGKADPTLVGWHQTFE